MRAGAIVCLCGALTGLVSAETPSASPAPSGLEGVVSITPARPGPQRDDMPATAPLPKAAFTVNDEQNVVASFTTDDSGRFRVTLPPGHYTVELTEPRVRRCGPFQVEIVAGKVT